MIFSIIYLLRLFKTLNIIILSRFYHFLCIKYHYLFVYCYFYLKNNKIRNMYFTIFCVFYHFLCIKYHYLFAYCYFYLKNNKIRNMYFIIFFNILAH